MRQPTHQVGQHTTPQYSVVVPVFNAAATLQELYERICATLEECGGSFELILVHDCGTDGSWEVASTIAKQDSRVVAIELMRNYGQSSATMCGLSHARGNFVITLDDDLQNPPEEIEVLIRAMDERPDLDAIFGAPAEKRHAVWRRLGSWALNRLSSRHIFETGDRDLELTSFRIMRRPVVDSLLAVSTPRPALGAMLCTITPRIANVRVRHEPRLRGRGGYTVAKLIGVSVDKTLSFSTLPLRTLAVLGLMGIIGSVILGAVYLGRYLTGGVGVPGWTTQVLLSIGIAGFNFLALGLVGEYLLRILQTVQEMPQFRVREVVVRDGGLEAGNGSAAPPGPEG